MPSAIENRRPTQVKDVGSEGLRKKTFRPDIQGIRALAVLVVIADHLFHWPTGGFVGVDVFFVISGFLITGILLREYEKTEHISFVGFYNRRIRRIIPAATLVLIATTVAAYFLFTTTRFWETAGDAFWSFIFLGNWHMAVVGTDYFQLGLPPSPVQHFWSLSVEEQFYFVWPWMMLGLLVVAAKIGWSKPARRRLIMTTFIVATAASFIWSMWETSTDPTFAYFSTFSRAWELGMGAILAAAVPVLSRLPNALRPVLGWIGLLGVLASVFLITSDLPFPGPWAAAPVLSTALLIAAGTGIDSTTYNWAMIPLTNRVSTYVGDISYSLYLWHFPIIILMLAVLPASSPLYILVCVVGMFALAMLSYHFVENAFRVRPQGTSRSMSSRARRRRRRRKASKVSGVQTILVLGLAVGTVALVAIALTPPALNLGSGNAVGAAPVSSQDATLEGTPAGPACRGADFMDAAKSATCSPDASPDTLVPTVDGLVDDTGDAYACYRGEDQDLKSCNYGSTSPDALRVAIVGDSHGAMLIPAIRPHLGELNWSLDPYVGYGCQWKIPQEGNCEEVMKQIVSKFSSDPYDVIISTGARWVGGDLEEASSAYSAAWEQAIANGTKVIVIADVPAASEEALACITRIGFDPRNNDCGTPKADALSQADPQITAASNTPVTLIDMTDYYCGESFCPSVIGSTQVYRDTASHVTASYMESLSPYLIAQIQAAIADK